jgi:transcriptional regulator with XRE-family HTH domain
MQLLEIGNRLRAYRLGSGLSLDDVAKRLRVSRSAIYRYEAGEVVKIEKLQRIARLLNVSLPALLGVGIKHIANAFSFFERVRRMIVEDEVDRRVGGIGRVEEPEEFDELAAAVAVFDQGVHLAGQQIDAGQEGLQCRGVCIRDHGRKLYARRAQAEVRGQCFRSPDCLVSSRRRRSRPDNSARLLPRLRLASGVSPHGRGTALRPFFASNSASRFSR